MLLDAVRMALTPQQQALEQITRAKRILVVTKEHAPNEASASASACALFLQAMGKQVDTVVPGADRSAVPAFLPNASGLRSSIGAMRAFNIALDVKEVPLGELMYDVKDGVLNITVVPKHGEWTPKHLSFKHGEDRYDLVIALDAPDMQSLGELSRTHADFLYRTTVINIDCDAANEHWGQINIVDLNAVSTTEVLFGLFDTWNRHLVNADIATALLAGMIAKTKSFRTPNVTPKTLTTASQLVAAGARREEIVHGLWRTRTVPILKLWGRALSRLEQDRDRGIVWTSLSRQDFLETGAGSDSLDDVTGELIAYAPDAKVVVFVYETETADGVMVSIHATGSFSAAELSRPFGGTGTRERAVFKLQEKVPLLEATKTVIERLRETIKQ
jgi:phosphoesterase RecJ-like protein